MEDLLYQHFILFTLSQNRNLQNWERMSALEDNSDKAKDSRGSEETPKHLTDEEKLSNKLCITSISSEERRDRESDKESRERFNSTHSLDGNEQKMNKHRNDGVGHDVVHSNDNMEKNIDSAIARTAQDIEEMKRKAEIVLSSTNLCAGSEGGLFYPHPQGNDGSISYLNK